MDWDRIAGNWKKFTGSAKAQWGKLTDDDLMKINGQREQLEGKIQEHYGYGKDQIREEVDTWLSHASSAEHAGPGAQQHKASGVTPPKGTGAEPQKAAGGAMPGKPAGAEQHKAPGAQSHKGGR